jgi:hypothetical protein
MSAKLLFDGLDNTVWRTAPKVSQDHDVIYVPSNGNNGGVDGRNRGWTKFSVKVGSTNLNESPTTIALAGKKDGDDEWMVLYQTEGLSPWSSNEQRDYNLGEMIGTYGSFKEYKFSFRSMTDRVSIAEIRIHALRREAAPSRGWPTCESERWTAFWWWEKGTTWPTGVTDVLGRSNGHCGTTSESIGHCFQRLPEGLQEDYTEILAVQDGVRYVWKFDSTNDIAHAAWNAFRHGMETVTPIKNSNDKWNPTSILKADGTAKDATSFNDQDSFLYTTTQSGVKSILLDDNGDDCHSTLQLGRGINGGGWGVDKINGASSLMILQIHHQH